MTEAAKPVVGVVMGSSSDWDVMQHAVAMLKDFNVAFEAQVVSAHRMADDMFAYAESARSLTDLYWVESSHLTEESGQRPADVRQRLSTFPQGAYRGVESPWPDSRRCWKFNVGLAGPAWRRPRSGRHRRAQSHRR